MRYLTAPPLSAEFMHAHISSRRYAASIMLSSRVVLSWARLFPGANTWYFHTGMVAPMYVSIRVGLLLYHRLASIYASLLKLSPVVPFPPQGCFLDSLLCKRYRVQWITRG